MAAIGSLQKKGVWRVNGGERFSILGMNVIPDEKTKPRLKFLVTARVVCDHTCGTLSLNVEDDATFLRQ